ncbi:MAG: SDR family NAD(P)-dependent oxidoreductase, partial [Magnetococcales bacterium]|nr:SDR family NAD(P)-dependent oxidoreductase [Magnetococcales bacterium]
MEGRVAIVTGSSSGIGRVIANEMARRKVRLFLVSNEATITEALAEVQQHSPESVAMVADVTRPEDPTRIFDQVMETFGGVDILVNNAGITRDNLL